MRSRPKVALGLLAVAIVTSRARTQDSAGAAKDSLPFHKGQWAAQFTAGTTFSNAGVLYFRSAANAWIATVSASYHSSSNRTDSSSLGPRMTVDTWVSSATLRFGTRHYSSMGKSTALFTTFGVLGTGGSSTSSSSFGARGKTSTFGAGVFGELGANYMITRHLSLGASAGIQATYQSNWSSDDSGLSSAGRDFLISGALLSLTLGVYF